MGGLDAYGYLEENGRIGGEIPDPTFGFMRRSSMGYRKKDDALRGSFFEWDVGNLAYVDHFGWMISKILSCVRRADACVGIICDTREDGNHLAIVGQRFQP